MTAQAEAADLELVEMVNLPTSDTGIGETIHVSTAQGSHGQRVKWFPGRPGREAPWLTVTISDASAAINHGLPPRTAEAASRDVIAWVAMNRTALLDFWTDGTSWTRQDVTAFADRLHRT